MSQRLRTSLSIIVLTVLGVLTNLSLDAQARHEQQHQQAQVAP